MGPPEFVSLSRRERQMMEVLYRLGRASVAEVREGMPDPPSYSAVRALLGVLEEKGGVTHERVGRKYVYRPTVAQPRAKRGALRSLMRTFFDGSPEKLVAALLDPDDQKLPADQIERIRALVRDGDGRGAVERTGG